MKHIYIFIFSLVLVSCGKSDKQTQSETDGQVNDNLVFVNRAQFDSGKMELGVLEEHVFNETIKKKISEEKLNHFYEVTEFINEMISNKKIYNQETILK